MLRTVLLALLAILVIIQFIRPEKNQAAGLSTNDITTKYAVPAEVHNLLKRSCFDCHSNNTTYPAKKARHKLEEVGESVTEGWMPLKSYLWIHHDAKLKPEEAKLIASWASGLRQQIPAPAGEEKEGEHHGEEH